MSNYGRRGFIKTGLLATSGILLASDIISSAVQNEDQLVRVGVIGTGQRGTGIISLINQIDNLEVTAISDIIPFRLADSQLITPGARAYLDYRLLLEDKEVDAIIITTPFSTHDEIAIAALDAGKHVYCEKTMVKGITETQSVIDKARTNQQLVFQTGHQYHSSPLYNRVRNIIRSGYIGEVTAYHCQWNRNGSWRRPVPDPKWERMINWRMYREYSGGLVAELMSHQIDFINWITDSHPDKIMGFGGIDHYKDGRETFDNIHLQMVYPNGLDSTFSCTTTNGYDDYQIRVLGSEATIILDYKSAMIFTEHHGEKVKGIVDGVSGATAKAWQRGEGVPIAAPGNDPTLDALRQFYRSIAHQEPVVSDIKTGATTSKCVQMSLDALYEEKIVKWQDYPELDFG